MQHISGIRGEIITKIFITGSLGKIFSRRIRCIFNSRTTYLWEILDFTLILPQIFNQNFASSAYISICNQQWFVLRGR